MIKEYDSRYLIVSALTFIVTICWSGLFIARTFFNVGVSAGPTLDAAMLLILGYWFSTTAIRKDNGDGKEIHGRHEATK